MLLLEAPAGFGKTLSLRQVSEAARRVRYAVAWVGLRPTLKSPAALGRRLVSALASCDMAKLPKAPAADTWGTDGDPVDFVAELVEGIHVHRRRILLVLDDYDIVDSETVHTMLGLLLEQMPANLSVAIASRRACPLPLSRPLLDGRLLRLEKRELHFSKAETREFFAPMLSPAELSRIYRLTEGWPGALQVAKVCASEWHGEGTDIHNAPGFTRLIGNYCRTEVLRYADPEALDLLTECSITETLDPGACDAIRARDDSAQILARMAGRETFMEPVSVEKNSWRLPVLLNQILRRRMSERGARDVAALHLRVAQYYQRTGPLLAALHHYADAGHPAAAAAALESASPLGLVLSHGDSHGRSLLDAVAHEFQVTYPRLVLMRAYLDYKQGMLDQANKALIDLATKTDDYSSDRPGGDDAQLKSEATAVQAFLEFYRISLAPLERVHQLERQLATVGIGDRAFVGLFHIVIGCMYRMRGDFESAEHNFVQCATLTAGRDAGWMTTWLRYHHGLLALGRGQLAEARYLLHAGLKQWRTHFPTDATYRAVARIALAEIDYEADSLSEAQAKLDESVYTAEHVEGWFEPYAAAYETAMMIQWHAGQPDQAEMLLARATSIPRVGALLERFLHVLHLRLELLRGRVDGARKILDGHFLAARWWTAHFQDELSYREWDMIGQCLCQWSIRHGALPEARRIVDRLGQVARLAGRTRSLAKSAIHRAVISWNEGDRRQAITDLMPAIQLGHAHGFRRTFLDEGEAILPVLASVGSPGGNSVPAHLVSYAASLCNSISGKSRGASGDASSRLSEREQEVVRELSQGHSDKLIARKLGLSAPTVKFHVRNVFRKLGVRKRAAAVATAHRHGWL